MASNLGASYLAPSVYTQTSADSPTAAVLSGLRLPVFLGTAIEDLVDSNRELVRGSSSQTDQRIPQEDAAGHAVVSISNAGVVTLGDFDGALKKIQTQHYPLVSGKGGQTSSAARASDVLVTINKQPIVILSITPAKGILELSTAPKVTDDVRVTYFYKRTDTLVTDDVSDQITSDSAEIRGALASPYTIVTDQNDVFNLTVDGVAGSVTIPSSGSGTWTAAEIAVFINTAFSATSLVASTVVNNFGSTVVLLTADKSLLVGDGDSNSTLGFANGQTTARNAVFHVFNGPIVDGTNGGVTTTDTADVTVKVDGVQVIPTEVDGANRAVTLSAAPASGSTVTISYYFNTWQDTYDELYYTGVTDVTMAGVTSGRSDYTEGVDFILKNDKILWGSAVLTSSLTHTSGATYLDDTQITASLVDARSYLTPCVAVTDGSVSPPVESRLSFTMPFTPTTGNGRDTPLGTANFVAISNGRQDLPTTQPALVYAYWGFGVQDAINRGRVTVTKVDGSVLTLASAVPVGASVYATLWYNELVDQAYSVVSAVAGASGVGSYTVQNEAGTYQYAAQFGSKSAGLAGITVQFPAGSEKKPDSRFESPLVTTDYVGPVEETVTATFAAVDGTLGEFTVPGHGDYEIILDQSDRVRITVDGSALAPGAAGIDLGSTLGTANLGFHASMVGTEVPYDVATGELSYEIDSTNNAVNLTVDGVLVSATAASGAGSTLAAYVTAINTAGLAAPPKFTAAGKLNSSVVITASTYDQVRFHYTGDVAGASGNLICTLTPGTYVSASTLATEVQTQMQAAIDAYIATPHAAFAGLAVVVTANADSRLVFALTKATGDAGGFLEFITNGTPARDFAVLAGIDTAAATTGAQTKLFSAPIARRITVAGDNTGALLHDRLVVRSRVIPGFGTVYPFFQLSYTGVTVEGGNGATNTGLTVTGTASAGWRGCVLNSTAIGYVGFGNGGQVPAATYGDSRDGMPFVTFYAAGGTIDQNNIFKFTMDGVPVTVSFTDAAGVAIADAASADVPLGPGSSANTILGQIRAAMTAAGIGSVSSRAVLEGPAIRLYSATDAASSEIIIGNGSANDVLGFVTADVTGRTLVTPKVLASALMSHIGATISAVVFNYVATVATYFATEALASVVSDSAGAEYLYIQSQGSVGLGTQSSVAFATPSSASILRPGTGLGIVSGDGGTGEEGISGFYLTSSDTVSGSGTVNTSVLNPADDGTGQDGIVGQTYRDLVTGLTFTVLARDGGSNYPAGSYFTLTVKKTILSNANLPTNVIPGIEMVVSNTLGVAVGDSATVETFERGGSEPAVGDLYYATYTYTKQDYTTQLYTKLSTIEQVYGGLSVDNQLTVAAYEALINGAVLVGLTQIQKDTDSNNDGIMDSASVQAYMSAVDELEGPLPGNILPDILIPLRGDSLELFNYMTKHADVQSDIRHQAERTILGGFAAGTEPKAAGAMPQAIQRTRMRFMYPDIYTITLPAADGGADESVLVDGTVAAAMMAGSLCSPNTDVATPWENRRLFGGQVARTLSAVEMNQAAVTGLTILEARGSVMRVRHGLTSDMTGVSMNGRAILSKIPTIITIADEVQQQTRATLEPFIGQKFLAGILGQIEGRESNMLKGLVNAQIIGRYTGVKATMSPTDATTAEVSAAYTPVFPLLFVLVQYSLQS